MGHVREQRATRILEDVLQEWLDDGIIPTPGLLKERYDEESEKHGDLTRSSLRGVQLPERWGESSAAEFNNVLDSFGKDVDVLLKALILVTELSIRTLVEWNARGKALDARVGALKARVESLLLLKSDAAGYISFVEDGFFSLENISSDTTANVDTHTGEVTLSVDRTESEGSVEGTQVDLRGSTVEWTLIEGGNAKYSTGVS